MVGPTGTLTCETCEWYVEHVRFVDGKVVRIECSSNGDDLTGPITAPAWELQCHSDWMEEEDYYAFDD